MNKQSLALLAFSVLALSACGDLYDPTMRPDYVIKVTPTAQGSVATLPTCPKWTTDNADPYDNQPLPQFGCANARNLAAMVENPKDLVQGRALDNARGVTSVGAVRRYDNNQARGLVWTGTENNQAAATTSSTASSGMTGDVTGAASASSSSSSSSSSAGASAATP